MATEPGKVNRVGEDEEEKFRSMKICLALA